MTIWIGKVRADSALEKGLAVLHTFRLIQRVISSQIGWSFQRDMVVSSLQGDCEGIGIANSPMTGLWHWNTPLCIPKFSIYFHVHIYFIYFQVTTTTTLNLCQDVGYRGIPLHCLRLPQWPFGFLIQVFHSDIKTKVQCSTAATGLSVYIIFFHEVGRRCPLLHR